MGFFKNYFGKWKEALDSSKKEPNYSQKRDFINIDKEKVKKGLKTAEDIIGTARRTTDENFTAQGKMTNGRYIPDDKDINATEQEIITQERVLREQLDERVRGRKQGRDIYPYIEGEAFEGIGEDGEGFDDDFMVTY